VVGDEVADTAAEATEEEVDATAAKAEADEVADTAAEATEEEVDATAAKAEEDEVAAASEADDERQDQVALISLEGVNLEALPEIDADISFQGQFVAFAGFRFDQLGFDLQLRDAVAVLDASGHGQYRDEPLSLEAHAGTEESLENPEQPYPVDLKLDSEETKLAVKGTVARPGQLAGLDVDVALAGPDLDRVGDILQLNLPATPPFDLQSHLTRDGNRWHLTGLNGTIGDSDIRGDATVVLGGARPTLEAELTSNRLDFDDLGLLVGAPADAEETVSVEQERAAAEQAAKEGVLPDEPFDVPELRAMDARVSYRAEQVQAQKLPLEGVELDLTLEDGQLRFEPLRLELAGGALDSVIRLDGRTDVLAGDLELNVRDIRLNQLLSRFDIEIAEIEMEQEGVGTFSGHAQLAMRGNSIQELAGSADGQVVFLMRGGQINALIMEAVGLDIGEAVALLLTGDEEEQSEMVPIQCFVGNFEVQDGVMQAEALVLETTDSTVTGKGQIDLGEETLSLELLAHPKDASALSASTPVRIEGTFKNPEIDPISEELQEKSLAALALGVVLPVIGAIIPFFEEGETEDTNCARLIEAAMANVEEAAPAPQSD
jgi:AsmA family protein